MVAKVTRALMAGASYPQPSYLEAMNPDRLRHSVSGGSQNSTSKHRRGLSRGSFELFNKVEPGTEWSFVPAIDELCISRSKNHVFCGFIEQPITFPPRWVVLQSWLQG